LQMALIRFKRIMTVGLSRRLTNVYIDLY